MIATYLIFGLCMCGCAGQAYFLGRRLGIESTINYLVDEGVLQLEEEGNG